VQIRHFGFKTISRSFDSKEEAEEFLIKASRLANLKVERKRNSKALKKLKENI